MNLSNIPISIYVLIFILNLVLAYILKSSTKELSKQYKSLKYIYLIPPIAILVWKIALIIFVFGFFSKKAKKYFED